MDIDYDSKVIGDKNISIFPIRMIGQLIEIADISFLGFNTENRVGVKLELSLN
jgi:hypothetical protein